MTDLTGGGAANNLRHNAPLENEIARLRWLERLIREMQWPVMADASIRSEDARRAFAAGVDACKSKVTAVLNGRR